MHRTAFLAIGLFFGTGLGFYLAAANNVALDGHHHGEGGHSAHHSAKHSAHQPVDMPAGPSAPTLALSVLKDTKSGLNIHVQTTNFTFTPETVNLENVPGAGHAHIYINGKKIARAYGPWFHADGLPDGTHTVMVELNANDHSPLSVGGTLLRVEQQVTLP